MKWLVIQTRLCDYEIFNPILTVAETPDAARKAFNDIQDTMDLLERNDMRITAVPLAKVAEVVLNELSRNLEKAL